MLATASKYFLSFLISENNAIEM